MTVDQADIIIGALSILVFAAGALIGVLVGDFA